MPDLGLQQTFASVMSLAGASAALAAPTAEAER